MPAPVERTESDQLRLEQIQEKNQRRSSLILDTDYDNESETSLSSTGPELKTKIRHKADHVNHKKSLSSLKLKGKTITSDDLTELKKWKVDKRRFSNEGHPKSRFNDVKFTEKQSILEDSTNWSNPFAGFFVLFWLGVAFLILTTLTNYILEKGWKFELFTILITDLVEIGLTDLWMYCSIYFVFGLHYLIKLGYIDWERSGWVISSIYEFGFLVYFMFHSENRNYPWIGKIFLYLHSLVLLMKMHSYSFYNGYLWRIKKELAVSTAILKKNDENLTVSEDKLVQKSISFCQFELKSQSVITPFPSNITFNNFFWYTMFPTLVYEIDYPRTEKIRWSYVFEKLAAIFGVITLMLVVSQQSLYPLALQCIELRELPIIERIQQYPLLLLNIIPNFLLIYILDFYLIWDAILNCIAELSRFGDREFYGYWWNCVSWDEFSRLWNIPVHKFLLRHVYHSSISALHLSKGSATIFTFLLSSVVHEGAMFVIFHKVRGYLFLFQMFQLPLVAISRTKYLKDKKTLGNIVFWFGIAFGPSLMCTMYLTF